MDNLDINRLWQNFTDTISNHYLDFNGRVGRPQFWYYVLVAVVIGIGVAIVGSIVWMPGLSSLYGLLILLPNAGMAARRLQDVGRSGSLVWVALIPLAIMHIVGVISLVGGIVGAIGFLAFYFTIGWLITLIALVAGIAILYFCIQPGQPEANQYGPVPPVFEPGAPKPAV
ncbi:MAG TPA: DUF805 domain-containing protein [Rhizomicrobium sp.]|nr:DUF805 domain-containing protein [Rhizomicrobium sp.]